MVKLKGAFVVNAKIELINEQARGLHKYCGLLIRETWLLAILHPRRLRHQNC